MHRISRHRHFPVPEGRKPRFHPALNDGHWPRNQMTRFVLRRMLAAVPIGLVVTLGVFALVFAMPGDPLRELAGDKPIPAVVLAAKRAQFHLDEPFLMQYLAVA